MKTTPLCALIVLALAVPLCAEELKEVLGFEADTVGEPPGGFTSEVGEWVVERDSGNKVLAQRAKNDDDVFNGVRTWVRTINVLAPPSVGVRAAGW